MSLNEHLRYVLDGGELDAKILEGTRDIDEDGVQLAIALIPRYPRELVAFLQAVLAERSFEEILSLVSVDKLLQGLDSGLSELELLVVSLVAQTQPADLVASTPFVEALLLKISAEETSVANSSISALVKLAKSGELVNRRLLSGTCLNLLREYKKNADGIVFSRYMALIQELDHVPSELYDVPLYKDDVLLLLNQISFFRTLVARQAPIGDETISAILELQASPEASFLRTELNLFMGALSARPHVFEPFDQKYKLVQLDNGLLACINPEYLAVRHQDLLNSVPIRPAYQAAIENLATDKTAFSCLDLTPQKLAGDFPFPEMVSVASVLVQSDWGRQWLLESQDVMRKLIASEVTDTHVIASLSDLLYQMYLKNPSSHWRPSISHKLAQLSGNKPVSVAVESSTS